MNKIFLSHSSKDKGYVGYIAEQLGRDHCVYDSMCFEAGLKNLDEIFREMDNSSIFVVFLSENSLSSSWVQKELSIADQRLNYDNNKLSQILPIIIDPKITHMDQRIPDFLKSGFLSYNLRVISSNKVAYRKIKAQQLKLLYKMQSKKELECFYGRMQEITNFKKKFDLGDGINCVIASGLVGIGRKSYLLQAIKESKIIEQYYIPATISLPSTSSIEDLIIKLSEVGFGSYNIEDLASLSTMKNKIDILCDILKTIQDYKEQIIIYDEGILIQETGDIIFWFEQALQKIRKEVTILIASKYRVNFYSLKNNTNIFFQELSTLPPDEWNGLMRVYANFLDIEISSEDRKSFHDIIEGYPPQVRYCVELIKETSVEEVKSNKKAIAEHFFYNTSKILEQTINPHYKTESYGLLAFMSFYGIVPTDILLKILNLNNGYKAAFTSLTSSTICRKLGISNEYIEVNPVVRNYIQRNKFELPKDIIAELNNCTNKFNEKITTNSYSLNEDHESILYYLKSNIINGKEIPTKFMYSTIYLSSAEELYNNKKYTLLISIVEKLKEINVFFKFDMPAQSRLQVLYCRALARQTNKKFHTEVEFFKNRLTKNEIEYNFLKGFMFRHSSQFDKALNCYKKVLELKPQHRSAMREIVIVYRGLLDYESAYNYARKNYDYDPENPYHIQPFFEILVRKDKKNRTEHENKYIAIMLEKIKYLHETKKSSTYYEIAAQYATYIEDNSNKTLAILEEGLNDFPDSSHLVRTLFDCSEHFNLIDQMNNALKKLQFMCKEDKTINTPYKTREAIYYAHLARQKEFIYGLINNIEGINEDAKKRLQKRIYNILQMKQLDY